MHYKLVDIYHAHSQNIIYFNIWIVFDDLLQRDFHIYSNPLLEQKKTRLIGSLYIDFRSAKQINDAFNFTFY